MCRKTRTAIFSGCRLLLNVHFPFGVTVAPAPQGFDQEVKIPLRAFLGLLDLYQQPPHDPAAIEAGSPLSHGRAL
jgi:hypothetical protein